MDLQITIPNRVAKVRAVCLQCGGHTFKHYITIHIPLALDCHIITKAERCFCMGLRPIVGILASFLLRQPSEDVCNLPVLPKPSIAQSV